MAELLRPGVEVIQALRTPSPTFVRPTLVPCVVGPAFEIINVLNTDGTINSKAKYGAYSQIGKTITQSAFPDHRGNIDELDVIESSIRPFILSGGSLSELLMNPGESFLATSHASSKAAIETAAFNGLTGLPIVGKVLVLSIDNPVPADTSNDITITFKGTGANLTAAQCADQINEAVGQTIASVVGSAPNDKVRLTTARAGAKSSITVRAGASANGTLLIGDTGEERVVGSGYRAQDDNDNDTTSPWIEFYRGGYFLNGVEAPFPAKAGLINIETGAFVSAKAAAITFGDTGTIPLKVGDLMFGDGVKVKNAEVMKVETDRFRLGTINTTLSTADANGRYITKVYDSVEVETLFDDNPFAPQYVWFKAAGLVVADLSPVAASVTGATAGAPATPARVQSSAAITVPVSLAGLKIHYVSTINGVDTEGEFTFTGGPFNTVAAIAAAIGTDDTGKLVLTSLLTGRTQAIRVKADGTANTALNFSTVSDTVGTGTDVEFRDIPANLVTSGQGATTTLTGTTLIVEVSTDGGLTWPTTRTHGFTAEFPNAAAIAADLQADAGFAGSVLSASASGTELSIKSVAAGQNIAIRIGAASTALGAGKLQFTSGQSDIGEEELNGQTLTFTMDKNPHVYSVTFSSNSLDLAIDEINAAVGAIVASKAGSGLDHLKLTSTLKGAASEVKVAAGVATTAFGLPTSAASGSARPYPDAYLDGVNNLVIGSQILRDQVTGYPLDFATNLGDLYIQFKGLRKDVSAAAQVAGVLRIPDQATLAAVLDPLTEENPLGLALFMCLINAPGLEVKGLGVDEISGAAPEGTEAAYARAAGFLESEEVYALAPLTHNEVVHGIWSTHVVAMSAPEQGGERIVFINKKMPVEANPVVAASGTKANSTVTNNQMLLDVNPAAGLVAAGINPALPIPVSAGVFMEFEVNGEFRRYNVSSVSGSLVNLNVTFTGSQNTDGFYTTTALTETVVNASWSLKVRGKSLIVPSSNPPRLDYSLVAETVAQANAGIKNRRLYSVFPDTIKTTIGGVEKSLPGYYACAAIAGMCAGQPPQQGFTNFPITGLTGVVGTEKFSKKQLNNMAGGGTYILIQDVQGGPVSSRHQVSTDLTSIETRELSITKVVDFTAKFLRASIKKFIGVQTINEQFLDTVGTTIQGILNFLVETGVLNGAELNNILQDEENPDTVLVDITLDVPYPANYIRLTLVV
jgi:hypothetical protein